MKITKAIKTISKVCSKQSACFSCPLYDTNELNCIFDTRAPYVISDEMIDRIKEWEVNYAKTEHR